MNLYRNEVFLSLNKAGKCNMNDKELVDNLTECNPVPPRFGYNWFYVVPNIKTNFRRKENTINVFTLNWLMYSLYLDSNIWFTKRLKSVQHISECLISEEEFYQKLTASKKKLCKSGVTHTEYIDGEFIKVPYKFEVCDGK